MADSLLILLKGANPEGFASALLIGTCLFSVVTVIILLLRHALLRIAAKYAYPSWALVPASFAVAMASSVLPTTRVTNVFVDAQTVASSTKAAVTSAATYSAAGVWLLLGLWLTGALLCFAYMAWQHRRFSRGLNLVSATSELRASDDRGPALIGLWRPRLVLPSDFETRFTAEEQTLVRAHEATHQQRYDHFVNAFAALLLCLQWFNPLAYAAYKRMRADQEIACDAAVLRKHPDSFAPYARALAKAQSPAMASAFACQWQTYHPLIERIRMLEQHNATRTASWGARILLLASALVAAAFALATQTSSESIIKKYELDLRIVVNDTEIRKAKLVMSANDSAGTEFVTRGGGSDTRWIAEWSVRPAREQGFVDLRVTFRHSPSEQAIAQPRMIFKEGQPASIEQSSADGTQKLKVEVIATAQ